MKLNSRKPRNLSGKQIRKVRQRLGISQRKLAEMMQENGVRITSDTISKIEMGKRLVADFELRIFATVLHTDILSLTKNS